MKVNPKFKVGDLVFLVEYDSIMIGVVLSPTNIYFDHDLLVLKSTFRVGKRINFDSDSWYGKRLEVVSSV